jgi:hypothetical protein
MLSGDFMWNIKLWLLVCEVFYVSVLWHLQRFGMLVMHLWSEITLRSLKTNRLLYCPVVVWMLVHTLSERVCLRGLVGVRTLCVYLDLPLDASFPFWLHHDWFGPPIVPCAPPSGPLSAHIRQRGGGGHGPFLNCKTSLF